MYNLVFKMNLICLVQGYYRQTGLDVPRSEYLGSLTTDELQKMLDDIKEV